jgi:hypothetical protein
MTSVIAASERVVAGVGQAADAQQRSAARGNARREAGETLTAIARTFGVSHTTISRL